MQIKERNLAIRPRIRKGEKVPSFVPRGMMVTRLDRELVFVSEGGTQPVGNGYFREQIDELLSIREIKDQEPDLKGGDIFVGIVKDQEGEHLGIIANHGSLDYPIKEINTGQSQPKIIVSREELGDY